MGVDYVIVYRFNNTEKAKAAKDFEKLTETLSRVGLVSEVRSGVDLNSVLIFVKVASEQHLFGEVYRSRVRDWIHGVRASAPDKDTRHELDSAPLTEAERLRIIYQLITNAKADGGAGITPKHGEWKNVDTIFALHDHEYNKQWIKEWSTKYYLGPEDLDAIRARLGEKIGFYFAFTQSYFTFLLFPAAFGLSTWLLLGSYSPIYAVINAVWCIVFTEYWKHQEYDLAVRWGVRGVSTIQNKRKDFSHEKTIQDPVTGEMVHYFPATKRFQRQLLQVPFTIVAVLLLGSLIATCFGIEIFISEVYNGPLKSVLVFLPTGILSTCMPILTALLTNFATQLNKFENYETDAAYERAFTQKIFVLNFITSYLPIILTAFVYVPFGKVIVPYLDVFSLTVKPFAQHEKQLEGTSSSAFEINPARLTKQVIYFTVTAQVVNLATEVIMPYVKRRGMIKYQEMQSKKAARESQPLNHDSPEEASFLTRVRSEAALTTYDVTSDLREMVLQFGYLSLFSVVWPLTAVSFLVNDWVELRADAIKICVEMQRPTPQRSDTIGSWLDSLSFLTWLGSLTTAALVYMFSNDDLGPHGTPENVTGWALLLSIFFAEHAFLLVRWMVQVGVSKLDSPGRQQERKERYRVRTRYYEENLAQLNQEPHLEQPAEKITKESLEEDARQTSLGSSNPEDKFWKRQRGWRETAEVGRRLIEESISAKTTSKKQN
jgi:hypothetical protein